MANIQAEEKKALVTISQYMQEHNETLAVGESVTAGLMQSRFSLATDATFFFQGGITAYNLGQKVKHLGIDPILGDKTNCVSDVIAADMAVNVAKLFNSSWGIGITGYAAPVPALKIHHRYALYAFAYGDRVIHEGRLESKLKGALNVQHYYVSRVIRLFAGHLNRNFQRGFK